MTLTLVTPPVLPVLLAEAKAHLREDGDEQDALINGLIEVAYGHAEKWTGTAFAAATWDYTMPAFPACATGAIRLPKAPVQSIGSITYFDADDASQTLPATGYRLNAGDGIIAPRPSWPSAYDRVDAVTVRFTAGGLTPPEVKSAMLLMIGHWFMNREAVADGSLAELPMGVYALLNLHRQMFV